MKKHKIRKWKEIKDDFKDKLLLGNGASIAVWDGFNYSSLYEEARKADRIGNRLDNLFKDFETTDFEHVLRLLSETKRVNELLGIDEGDTSELYGIVKETLRQTISDIHPAYEDVESSLLPIADFMKQFSTVLSLNYDLVVYWAMLKGNDNYGQWFKDAFVEDGRFENDFDYLYKPYYDAEGATLVFYPHGNFILATELFGDEIKLTRSGEVYLLDTVLSTWEQGEYIPLFVSEGNTAEKLRAIRRSNYLDTVYDGTVERPSDTMVIYGWSFRDEDDHILKALVNGEPKTVAISVHIESGDVESYCERAEYKISNMHHRLHKKSVCKIQFFDAGSEGCWNNPN